MTGRAYLALLCVMFVTGCGGDDRAAVRTAPAEVTPVPTEDAPVPSPTADIHTSPTPTATATQTATATPATGGAEAGEPSAGDEEGIQVPVSVTVTPSGIAVDPPAVPAFLPMRVMIRNTFPRPVTIVARLAGGELQRARVPAGATGGFRLEGMAAQTIRITSPELGRRASAELLVRPGG